MTDSAPHIATVAAELAAADNTIGPWDPQMSDAYFARRKAAMATLTTNLETSVGAKITERYDGARVRIGGISATSTGGVSGAIRNWLTAARKRAA